ncbi:CK1/CK1 protein kinase [Vavraia culicis subsp. floridensis]|uniref:CK1/CK1 protein kinase n=1 Tax=Vavraia culicis (isolate floridensis) TaxID=948595 RepID=L2GTD9_VAVCU|nr:CK1/CK1 protein kinase [Vavraia culicis subsp. floridensis]ELA46360.1 CK1/CK1 protein kinase [Vavraia culicis subsp. floridensis]
MIVPNNNLLAQPVDNKIKYQKRTKTHPNKIKKSLMIEGDIIGNYKITKKLGQGSFGIVYEVEDSSGTRYALKLESVPVKTTSQLKNEYRIYTDLKGCKGIALVHYFGKYDNYYYLVMDRLGPSLQDLYERRKKNFSVKTICMIAITVLESLEDIHGRCRIFRDIKPENILIGHDNPDELFLIDLGMAKYYMNPNSREHIPFINNKKLTGTARYASLNTHMGYEQSRRDDLESLGYTLIYFLRGNLPWMGVRAATGREKHTIIGEKKKNTSLSVLCSDLPAKTYLVKYLEYVRNLNFVEKPSYKYLIGLFKSALSANDLSNDKNYDWVTQEYKQRKKKRSKNGWWHKFKDFINVCKSEQ